MMPMADYACIIYLTVNASSTNLLDNTTMTIKNGIDHPEDIQTYGFYLYYNIQYTHTRIVYTYRYS